VYDALGRVESQTHSDGTVVTTSYTGRSSDARDGGNGNRNVEHVFQSDALGRLTGVCEVTGSTQDGISPAACGLDYSGTGFLTTYSYDPLGNLANVSQGAETRRFVYDMASRLTQASNPETGMITYTYDMDSNCPVSTYAGELISRFDARGIRTCMQYDTRGRVLVKTYSDGTPSASYAYNQTSVAGRVLTNTIGRLSSEATAGAYPTGSLFSYDAMGDIVDNSQCTPQNCSGSTVFPVTYSSYNVLGEPFSATDGDGHTFSYGYNSAGRLTSVTSSLSVLGTYPGTLLAGVQYNAFGSPVSSLIGAIPLIDSRGYDVRGRLTSISVADSSATASTGSLTINGSEQGKGGATPATGTITIAGTEQSGYFCNPPGPCKTIFDSGTVAITLNGTEYEVTYGALSTSSNLASALASQINSGGLATATVAASTIDVTTVAKGASANYSLVISSLTNNSGDFGSPSFYGSTSGSFLTGGSNASGPYDNGTVTLTINGAPVSANYGEYDTPDTVATSLAASVNANASFATATASGSTISLTSKATGAYTDYSLTTSSASTNGFSPPSFSASLSGSSMTGGSGGSVYSATVSRFPNGDVENSSDSVNGNWNYAYDDFNRLGTAVSNTSLGCSEVYDLYGDRLQQNPYQGSCFAPQYTSTGSNNRINQFSYDLAGDVTNDQNNLYTYDAEGRISTVENETGGLVATYIYDAEGRRVRKILAGGATDDYVYDLADHVISDFSSSGVWNRGEVYAGGNHLATYVNGTTYFVHADWLGTERVRSEVNGAIDPGSEWTSYPFGEGSSNPNPSPLHFTGKERDAESGNDYFGARYYASTTGRFLSPDWSAKQEPVPYAKLDDPQSLNLYAYALNNPLRNTDPDGHETEAEKQAKIAAAAKAQNGSQAYAINKTNISNMQIFKNGSDKCNEFVSDTVKSADGTRPVVDGTGKIPTAAQFADPNVKINGLSAPEPMSNAKPGDVIAQDHGANPTTGNEEGHVGIIVALPHDGQPGQTASANANQGGQVTVNDWGFRSPTANPNNGERNGASSPAPVVRHPLGDQQ